MHIILADGTQLTHIGAVAKKIHLGKEDHDAIDFIFDDSYTYNDLDSAFTETNCNTIDIVTERVEVDENGNESIVSMDNYHYDYVIKHEIAKKTIIVNGVSKTEFHVTMGQLSYTQKKLAAIETQNMDTALAVAELGVLLAGGME